MFWTIIGGIILGVICLAIGYGLGKKKKIMAEIDDIIQKRVVKNI